MIFGFRVFGFRAGFSVKGFGIEYLRGPSLIWAGECLKGPCAKYDSEARASRFRAPRACGFWCICLAPSVEFVFFLRVCGFSVLGQGFLGLRFSFGNSETRLYTTQETPHMKSQNGRGPKHPKIPSRHIGL